MYANLLLIDDHGIIRTGLKTIVEHFLPHSKVDEAGDGESAYERIKHTEYDLLILDVNMPNTNSFGLINNILALKPDAKILMFSMKSEEIYAKRYLKMGAMGSKNNSENPFDKLSPREFEIVQHLIYGDCVSVICQKLTLHSSTVGTHKTRIFEKLNCSNIIDLNAMAKLHNIISLS